MKKLSLLFCAGALALAPTVASAAFQLHTVCFGQMTFSNDDGTFSTFDLELDFDKDLYLIRARNVQTGEIDAESGVCDAYLTAGCQHNFAVEANEPPLFYVFSLQKLGARQYFYTETWSDGFSGATMVDCRTDG